MDHHRKNEKKVSLYWNESYERNPLSQRSQKLSWRAINIYVLLLMSSLNVYCIVLPTYNEPTSLPNFWKFLKFFLPKKFFWKTVTLMICSDLNVSLTRRDVHLKTDKDRNSSTQLHDSHNGVNYFLKSNSLMCFSLISQDIFEAFRLTKDTKEISSH